MKTLLIVLTLIELALLVVVLAGYLIAIAATLRRISKTLGLVTFGDEVIGFTEIISDQAAIHEPEWEVNMETIPPVGTEVTIILRRP